MNPSHPRRHGIAQYIADVVINLVRFLGPDPAAITRAAPARKARPQD
ncbi:hypothetical protein K388_06949 [Streptomyces sp. KhCrAH-43]|nr:MULTISPECIES: hypothetical protein [unclassified Streptomyces]RAJ48683.1 hypothetical protein K388_06949 [Streptomyces sp. KhCrAH-43]